MNAIGSNGLKIHDAMVANGWLPLVCIQNATHWVRDGRHAVIGFEAPADSLALEQHVVRSVTGVVFLQTPAMVLTV